VITIMLLPGSPTARAGKAEITATGRFLGGQNEWKEASIVVYQASPLFGAQEYYLTGEGRVISVTVRMPPGQDAVEVRHEVSIDAATIGSLIAKVIESDVLSEGQAALTAPPPTCIGAPLLVLRNSRGEVRSVPFPLAHPNDAYEEAWLKISALKHEVADAQPFFTGDYAPLYVPEGFEWSSAILRPRKDINFSRVPTVEERALAEEEFWRMLGLQNREAEKVSQEE